MNVKYFALTFLLLFGATIVEAQQPCNIPFPYDCSEMNIGNLVATFNNAGAVQNFYWPNDGTNRIVFTEAQLIIAARIDTAIRYSLGFASNTGSAAMYKPGSIASYGLGDTNRSLWPSKYRVYRIAKNWTTLREGALKESYRKDLAEWPADLGAPIDTAGRPLFLGDQTTWTVWNDIDTSRVNDAEPLGAEIQRTTWAYEKDPILKNLIFIKYSIINKSNNVWNDFYAGNYLGGGISNNGSFGGTDSVLELQYAFSALPSLNSYGTRAPAFGFALLQGPVVSKAGGTAFNFGRHISEAVNQRAASASTYPGNLPFDTTVYRALYGINPNTNTPFINPTTGRMTRFTYTGDPITGSGWTEPASIPPVGSSFKELVISSGPLTVQPNDTVTVVGVFIAGQGKDRLQSISILKHFARYARSNYTSLLSPVRFPQPNVTVSVVSRRALLTWETNAEQNLVNGYKFQGYNVYQAESPNGPWTRIFTTDKNDGVIILSEEEYQPEFSTISSRGLQMLPNAGLQQHLIVERDSINQTLLVDGRPYYFTVRAIWENSNNRPMVVESDIRAVTAIPEAIAPGSVIADAATFVPHSRPYDDAFRAEVINPFQLKDKKYRATITNINDTISWSVVDDSTNMPLLPVQKTINGESTPIVDGFTLRLKKQLIGVRRDNQEPRGWEYVPAKNRWLTGASPLLLMDGFLNGLVHPTINNYIGRGGSKTKPNQLKRLEVRFSNVTKQKAYRYVDKVRGFPFNDPPRHASFAPFMTKRGSGYVYQDYVDVPFTVWEIDSLDGDLTPRQLAVAFVETNDSLTSWQGKYYGRGNVNGKWEPLNSPTGGGEPLFFFSSPYTETPQTQYTTTAYEPFFRPDSFDVMYILSSRADSTLRKGLPYTFDEGDIFRITPNYTLENGRTYTFTTSAPIIGNKQLAREQQAMEKISVFPNPYMGGHALEQSPTQRFVRILNLPAPSTVRIINLAGRIIRTFEHAVTTQNFADWDLRNDEGIKVASGFYLIHIESKDIGKKILKVMILYPDERFNTY